MRFCKIAAIFILLIIAFACKKQTNTETLFQLAKSEDTGIQFSNDIDDKDSMNIIQYLYYYNGAGVATADFDNDGLNDIFFVSNKGKNKLYINKGNLKFEDQSKSAAIEGIGNWKTGVTVADVNADGLLDIYVCAVSDYKLFKGKNQLFINKGKSAEGKIYFVDEAAKYGLDAKGLCTQAAFFDYDKDGDLDMYLLRHSVHNARNYREASIRKEVDTLSGDMLFHNYGGRFDDISKVAGIYGSSIGYGLGLSIADVNNDGWPDIYVGNDFHENDYLYLNQPSTSPKNSRSFVESIEKSTQHTSNFSMGNDIGDINNDGLLDILTMDMQPDNQKVLKSSSGADPLDIFEFKHNKFGYQYQYPKNALQLNRGVIEGIPQYKEIGNYAGIAATDWSWSPLIADFDNNGWKDIFISNGILRRPNDLDFLKFISDSEIQKNAKDADLIAQMPTGLVSNYFFKNKGDNSFINVSESWGSGPVSASNGAAYADLDNDGDLDIITNNINQPCFVYKNTTNDKKTSNYIKIQLKGNGNNTNGIGTKIIVFRRDSIQYFENNPTRGFQSASAGDLLIGLGKSKILDSVKVIWNDNTYETRKYINTYEKLVFKQNKSNFKYEYAKSKPLAKSDIALKLNVNTKYKSFLNQDVINEKLIPKIISDKGPTLEIGDLNNDGLQDIVVIGNANTAAQIFYQNKNATFDAPKGLNCPQSFIAADIALLDIDNDKDLDIYLVCNGNYSNEKNALAQDKLFLNDGKGNFTLTKDRLPLFYHNGSCIAAADMDNDGDVDIFVGSRSSTNQYGIKPTHQLLRNKGNGYFEEITSKLAKNKDIGMVTDAIWTDLNANGFKDLVLVGDWMPITIYNNSKNRFDLKKLMNTAGWWNTIIAADVNNDNRMDLIGGNLGLNTFLTASTSKPMKMFVSDFDNNTDSEPLITYMKDKKRYFLASKDELTSQMPSLKKQNVKYTEFANKSFDDIIDESKLQKSLTLQTNQLASIALLNVGPNEWEIKPLPTAVQWSSVNCILPFDVNYDKKMDYIVAGNDYGMIPIIGRCDASTGDIIYAGDNSKFKSTPMTNLGIKLQGEIRDLKILTLGNNKRLLLVARKNQSLQIFNFD
jgi:enediyne biosynthesis protein E4